MLCVAQGEGEFLDGSMYWFCLSRVWGVGIVFFCLFCAGCEGLSEAGRQKIVHTYIALHGNIYVCTTGGHRHVTRACRPPKARMCVRGVVAAEKIFIRSAQKKCRRQDNGRNFRSGRRRFFCVGFAASMGKSRQCVGVGVCDGFVDIGKQTRGDRSVLAQWIGGAGAACVYMGRLHVLQLFVFRGLIKGREKEQLGLSPDTNVGWEGENKEKEVKGSSVLRVASHGIEVSFSQAVSSSGVGQVR